MRAALGQPIIVENVTGAGGSIGVGRVARSTPDGYTIGIGQWGTNVASGAIYPLQFDLLKDFEPIALIATQPFLIVAKKTVPANDLMGLIAWLKANADKVSQGNSGVGTPSHVGGILFQNAIGARFQMALDRPDVAHVTPQTFIAARAYTSAVFTRPSTDRFSPSSASGRPLDVP